MTVRSAATQTDPGLAMALLRFEVAPKFDRFPDWDQVRAKLVAALDGRIALQSVLEEQERHYSRHRRASTSTPPQVRVTIDDAASSIATVIEVRAPDHGSVLYRLTEAIADSGKTITRALVNTIGAEVIDVFYVQNADGSPIHDPDDRRQLLGAITAAL